jgi:hypothetical protein
MLEGPRSRPLLTKNSVCSTQKLENSYQNGSPNLQEPGEGRTFGERVCFDGSPFSRPKECHQFGVPRGGRREGKPKSQNFQVMYLRSLALLYTPVFPMRLSTLRRKAITRTGDQNAVSRTTNASEWVSELEILISSYSPMDRPPE